ncbi:MAG: ABC transporter permease [Burkholderiales bacterium]|nr:ABC transporter permease [Burkholderiales bacterium]
MREFFLSLLALIRKELLMILKDKRGRIILVAPILIQTIMFGYVASFDLNSVDYIALDEDHSLSSFQLLQKFDASPIFHRKANIRNVNEIAPLIERKKAALVVHIGPDFERKLNLGEEAPVQLITDGRNSNVAGAAASYAASIVQSFNEERAEGVSSEDSSSMSVAPRVWYNPNLETRWSILSGMTFLLSLIQVLMISAQSVAREKESGSFDQLLVTPLSSVGILIGKAVPAVIVGLVQSTLILLVAVFWFKIPFAGSLIWFYSGLFLFSISVVGIGLCISAFSTSMQQAMLYCFACVMPMVLLSGFLTPVSSMPEIFQKLVLINPVLYGVKFAKVVFLQGLGPADSFQYLWPLLIIGAVTMGMAIRCFRTRLS